MDNKISEWEKSRWFVTEEYDRIIVNAVAEGYERYNDLPDNLKYNLALEIVKAERNSVFIDYDDSLTIRNLLIQIMLNKGSSDSVEDLCDYLTNHFMCNEHFIGNINSSIEDQIDTKKGGMAHA